MAQIYNSNLTRELVEGAKIQQNHDIIPNQLAEKVVPVMEVNPNMLRSINLIKTSGNSATGSVTVYTCPSDKDFYLYGVCMSYTKDVACDNVSIALQASLSEDGSSATVISEMLSQTLTAESRTLNKDFTVPLKLRRGSALILVGAFSVGALTKKCQIQGYVDG